MTNEERALGFDFGIGKRARLLALLDAVQEEGARLAVEAAISHVENRPFRMIGIDRVKRLLRALLAPEKLAEIVAGEAETADSTEQDGGQETIPEADPATPEPRCDGDGWISQVPDACTGCPACKENK